MNRSKSMPRPEHPKPQLQRDSWINLNGTWTCELDHGKSGMDAGRELFRSRGFARKIVVPFCPESRLSGIGHTDFIEAMWYHRSIAIPRSWAGKLILIHFGGVDYECEVFVDGASAGTHFGGSVSFFRDVTALVTPGKSSNLVLRIRDDLRSGNQPGGKQCWSYKSQGCSYTRTTGIWQTVWIEAVDPCGLKSLHIVPDLDGSRFIVSPVFHSTCRGVTFKATLKDGSNIVSEAELPASQDATVVLSIAKPKIWRPKSPFLYDLLLTVLDAKSRPVDTVRSYAGLRKVHIEGNRLFLNNKPLYLRTVLDQGFYPDGIWTAPSDKALRRDIELSMKAGFNGARLHQKVFEERFHYWADRLGYLTWGESASWGCDVNNIEAARNFISEWREILTRDRNHPSIIAWTPFNETSDVRVPKQHRRVHCEAYDVCKALDPTRPVNDASGYVHQKTDLWTVHVYEQDPKKLAEILKPHRKTGVFRNVPDKEPQYEGQPYFVDEYGGIKWIPAGRRAYADNSWGYGGEPRTVEEFLRRLERLTDAILKHKHISGYCYTQLTDVEQEQNGIYNYDRSTKFNLARIARIFRKTPEWSGF